MAASNATEELHGPGAVVKKATNWFIAVAVLFILLGLFAIAEPWTAGLGVTLLVGWLLMVGAVAHFISAFKGHGARHLILQVVVGLVYLIGGLYFLTHTIMGVSTLTLLLSIVILAEGVLEVVAYFRLRNMHGASWLLLNGIVTLLLGGMIWAQWPSSSIWAIGTLVGVNLLMTGISRLMLGLAARKLVTAGL
ncbi:MAG TPA: HdeD family acid-resistance protein [Candidatus Acidoferrum sp.]|nr:HdeD family acid-resistance protein [Candidatus Acidoferrum sp.]